MLAIKIAGARLALAIVFLFGFALGGRSCLTSRFFHVTQSTIQGA
jgi:hypothetical protein